VVSHYLLKIVFPGLWPNCELISVCALKGTKPQRLKARPDAG